MNKWTKIFSAMVILTAVSTTHAQQNGPPGGGDPGGGPGGGRPGGGGPGGGPGGPDGGPPDPEEMRAMMDKRIKSALQANDGAWSKLQPMIDKVEQLAHETDTGPLMHGPPHRPDDDGPGGPGGPGGGPDEDDEDHPHSPTETAITNLKKVLSDKASTDDAIATAMKAVEDAEQKAKDDLEAARKELKAATNLRQQAVLVALGVLN